MIKDLKPYSRYKDSAVVWLGEIPEHWGIKRAKWLFNKVSRPVEAGDEIVTCFRDGTVTLRRNRRLRGFTEALQEIGYQRVLKGDLVIHAMDAFAGAVGVSDSNGKCSPVCAVCQPTEEATSEYFAYVIREMARTQWILALSKGIRERSTDFRFEDFGNQPVPLPPYDEQSAIIRFLNYADRRIRQYIHAKQQLIKLLEEQKKNVVSHVVTHGLDPKIKTKLLGSSPEQEVNSEWKISRLWEISRIRTEKGRTDLDLLSVFLGRGVIRYGEGGGQVHKPSLDLSGYQVVKPGDLVLNNQQAWRGSVGVSEYLGIISPAYVVLGLDSSLLPRFADYLFKSRIMVSQFVTASKGVGDIQRDIHMPWLKNVRVPIPSLPEQEKIVATLDQELSEIERQLQLFDNEIQLLHEFRIHVVTDVVTGKLDVREAASKLPEQTQSTAVMDEGDSSLYGSDAEEPTDDVSKEAEKITI